MAEHASQYPSDFNALYDVAARAGRGVVVTRARPGPAREAVARLTRDVPDLLVQYDEATRLPVQVASRQPGTPLTPPAGDARAETLEALATRFVERNGDLWNLSEADAKSVEVVGVSRKGLPVVRMVQKVDGVEVFNSQVTAAVTADNRVLSVSGQLFAGAPAAAAAGGRAGRRAGQELSAQAAIAKALLDLTGKAWDPAGFTPEAARAGAGPYRFYAFRPPAGRADQAALPELERPVRVKDVLFPLGDEQFVPGYYMELWVEGMPAFSYVVDAVDAPDILFRKNLTSAAKFKYRVHNTGDTLLRPEDGPAPGTPHPTGKPDGFQALTITENLIDVESLLPNRPWLPSGAAETRGNNCLAYADLQTGKVFGKVTAAGTFDYAYDHAKPASDATNLQNSIVGMFFHVNWLHDRWYEAGFDEAAGNAQQDKFGLNDLDGDPILAEGNDRSGTDNANMRTPAVGSSPVMQMFEFRGTSPLPSRTSNHEALITFHEMGHYVTNRLVGNASGLTNTQGRAMGEGWGDFFAVCMTSQAGDDFANGAFAAGGWTDLTSTFKDNYYYSIRRYPYSADMAKNPLTFKHIGANAVLPSTPPRNPEHGGANEEVHNAGEVWCAALWEVFVNLVARHGHAEAERRMLRYVIGGLKLTPNAPTVTQARDGIITAAAGLDAADVADVWAGFAKRGMGDGAKSPPSISRDLTGVVESFNVPGAPGRRAGRRGARRQPV